jgi:hypothetical protein
MIIYDTYLKTPYPIAVFRTATAANNDDDDGNDNKDRAGDSAHHDRAATVLQEALRLVGWLLLQTNNNQIDYLIDITMQ